MTFRPRLAYVSLSRNLMLWGGLTGLVGGFLIAPNWLLASRNPEHFEILHFDKPSIRQWILRAAPEVIASCGAGAAAAPPGLLSPGGTVLLRDNLAHAGYGLAGQTMELKAASATKVDVAAVWPPGTVAASFPGTLILRGDEGSFAIGVRVKAHIRIQHFLGMTYRYEIENLTISVT